MTSHVARLYALAASILGLFLAWAGIAAAPWPTTTTPAAASDPRPATLAAYERQLKQDAQLVRRLTKQRAEQPPPAAPSVRIVTVPPVATTKTS